MSDIRNFFYLTREDQDKVRKRAGCDGYVICPHCNGKGDHSRFRICQACYGSGVVHIRNGKYQFGRSSR